MQMQRVIQVNIMKIISNKNWLYLGVVLLISTLLSVVVKYVLPLFIETYSKPLLWLAILFPAAVISLVLLWSKDSTT
jgi:hypothetical protein